MPMIFLLIKIMNIKKKSSEDFTLGFVKYLLGSTKTWEEVYQLIEAVAPRKL